MAERHLSARWLAAAVLVSLMAPALPLRAEPATAALSGVIRSAEQHPLAGARLLVAEREGGEVTRSEWTTDDGSFAIAGLEPGRYDLAVEIDSGLYVIRAPIDLLPGVNRAVQIAVGSAEADAARTGEPLPSAWNNPAVAGAIVLGLAILIGVLVKNATEDEISATTVQTGN